MSSIITGDSSTITTPLTATITNATNATPIVITTSADHLFATYDRVTVSGVEGNEAANGDWAIVKLSATTFQLVGSVGSGSYTFGGTVVNNSLTPQFTIPSDGDDLDAASVNTAFEALADRTQYLAARAAATSGQTAAITYIAAGPTEWTPPAFVRRIMVEGCGGGGGGGGGAGGGSTASQYSSGGGGGGGATRAVYFIDVEEGETYEIEVGDGGAGGAGGTAGNTGSDGSAGGATIFKIQGGDTLATFVGALGGRGGAVATSGTSIVLAAGGSTTAQHRPPSSASYPDDYHQSFCYGPGFGGDGTSRQGSQTARAGASSVEGYDGGAGGAFGDDDTNRGGGAGGGGAAGPYGDGAPGGDGGDAEAATTGNNAPATLGSPSNNTGAGGAGGGGGGGGTVGGVGANGSAGGSGVLILRVVG